MFHRILFDTTRRQVVIQLRSDLAPRGVAHVTADPADLTGHVSVLGRAARAT